MRAYKVSYWQEGPGRSHTENVLVLAKNKKDAKALVIKECGVYKADQPYVHVEKYETKEYKLGVIVKHLEEG